MSWKDDEAACKSNNDEVFDVEETFLFGVSKDLKGLWSAEFKRPCLVSTGLSRLGTLLLDIHLEVEGEMKVQINLAELQCAWCT